MQKPPIEFWFTMGSTYTYLTEMWLKSVEQSESAQARSRGPFGAPGFVAGAEASWGQ